nr:helicase [Tanacetum cinerariifolium]
MNIGNNPADNPSLANILQNYVKIHSNTIIRQDGEVQSYCGLRLTDIAIPITGASSLPGRARSNLNTTRVPPSNYPLPQPDTRTTEGIQPRYAQLWFFDTQNEIRNRMAAFMNNDTVVYVIGFQKRGLPHAHILLWLEEHCKCKTPAEIDDMISTEFPSPTDDPEGYKDVA